MKLTTTKIIRELTEKRGWGEINKREVMLIKDVRTIIDEHLRKQKGLTIKK